MKECLSQWSSSRSLMVLAVVAPPALGAGPRRDDQRLGHVEQVAELDVLDQFRVEDLAAILDAGPGIALLEAPDRLEGRRSSESSVRTTEALSIISSCSFVRMCGGDSELSPSIRRSQPLLGLNVDVVGDPAWCLCRLRTRPSSMPPRRPNTTMSRSELVPSRLAPCTDTHAHSPAA